MPILRQWTSRRPFLCAPWLALGAVLLLGGCGTQGDFGEVNPRLVRDDIHDWVGRDDYRGRSIAPSNFELTDDERQLRDLAFPLLEPPHERQGVAAVGREYGLLRTTPAQDRDRTAYYGHLVRVADRSPSARYARLIDDIRNDSTRLPGFFAVAGRVLDIDRKRRKSIAYVSLGEAERSDAINRMKENDRVIAMVRASLVHRVESYRYALGHLVVSVPSQQAVEAERLLNKLQSSVAYYRNNEAPTWSREPSLAFSN